MSNMFLSRYLHYFIAKKFIRKGVFIGLISLLLEITILVLIHSMGIELINLIPSYLLWSFPIVYYFEYNVYGRFDRI